MTKGQGSTEYLVILAVVLAIALIIVGILGQFTSFGMDAKKKESDTYWKSTYPLQILEHRKAMQYGGTMQMKIKNVALSPITIPAWGIVFDNITNGIGPATDTTIDPGETKTIIVYPNTAYGFQNCEEGQWYEHYVKIYYKIDGIKKVIKGKKPIVGICSWTW
jgi:hypothetical protein